MWNIFFPICLVFFSFPLSSFAIGEDVNDSARQFVLQEINDIREKVGVFPLKLDEDLTRISQLHTVDILDLTKDDELATKDTKTSLIGSDDSNTNTRFHDEGIPKDILVEHMQWLEWKGEAHILGVIENMFIEESDLFFLQDALSPVYQSVGVGLSELKKEQGGELYLTFSFSGYLFDNSNTQSIIASSSKWSPYLDMYMLERKWVDEINIIRKNNNLSQLVWSIDLAKSASDWTRYMSETSKVTHDRPNFESPHIWIEQYQIPFALDYESNYFTENTIRGVFSCIEGCKYSAFSELESRIDDFMAEASYNGSHYRSIMHQDWTHVGVDIQVVDQNEYYGTIHYGRLSPYEYTFIDLDPDHQSFEAIEYFASKEIISGYNDGTVRPQDYISRAEILKLIFLVLFEDLSLTGSDSSFIDVDASIWYAPFVAEASKKRIINGYSDGTFRPNQFVSKVEALKMIIQAAGKDVSSHTFVDSLKDVSAEDWCASYVSYALDEGLLRYGSPLFHPNTSITRGDVIYVLYELSKD